MVPIIDLLFEDQYAGGLPDDEDRVHVYRTAEQGGRDTGGRHTRADLTVLVNLALPNLGDWVDIHAVEVKPYWSIGRDSLYETAVQAAMQRCSHSWLVAYIPGDQVSVSTEGRQKAVRALEDVNTRLVPEAEDLGLGVAVVSSLREGAVARASCRPRRQMLDPHRVDEVLAQIAESES